MLAAGFQMTVMRVDFFLILISAAVACFALAGLLTLALNALNASATPTPTERPIAPTADDLRRIEADPKGKGAPIYLDSGERVGSFDILIEYVDAEGEATRRAITVVGFGSGQYAPGFMAYCHLRKAMRIFRLDRVEAVIDDDGEIHEDVPTFFRELGIGRSARAHFRTDVFGVAPLRKRRGGQSET